MKTHAKKSWPINELAEAFLMRDDGMRSADIANALNVRFHGDKVIRTDQSVNSRLRAIVRSKPGTYDYLIAEKLDVLPRPEPTPAPPIEAVRNGKPVTVTIKGPTGSVTVETNRRVEAIVAYLMGCGD